MALDISYADKKLRYICEREVVAKRLLPPAVVRSLRLRMEDLNAAEDLFDMPIALQFISKMPPGAFLMPLSENYYALFCAVDQNMPMDIYGNVNWLLVRWIKLLEISKHA